MKITINIDESLKETEIVVNCGSLTSEMEQMIAALQLFDKQITVTQNDELFIVDVSKIIYVESVDRKTFVYTSDDCFEMLVGAVIGIASKNQMSATSVTLPVMMVFSFLPMLSLFNETIEKIAKVTYSQQISLLVNNNFENMTDGIIVIAINLVLAAVLFSVAYRKNGME